MPRLNSSRFHGQHVAATLLHPVGESVGEAVPTLGEEALVEAGLLAHVAARLIDTVARRGGHIGNLEIFMRERTAASGDLRRARRVAGPDECGCFEPRFARSADAARRANHQIECCSRTRLERDSRCQRTVGTACPALAAQAATDHHKVGTLSDCMGSGVPRPTRSLFVRTVSTPSKEGARFLPGRKTGALRARESR